MTKVETAGTNTMVMPVLMPGTLMGISTRTRVLVVLAPRSVSYTHLVVDALVDAGALHSLLFLGGCDLLADDGQCIGCLLYTSRCV